MFIAVQKGLYMQCARRCINLWRNRFRWGELSRSLWYLSHRKFKGRKRRPRRSRNRSSAARALRACAI